MRIYIGPPFIEIMNRSATVCSASMTWSKSRNETCGTISYHIQLFNNDQVVRNLTTEDLEVPLLYLTPNTTYTFTITATDNSGVGMDVRGIFKTDVPTGMCALNYKCSVYYGTVAKVNSLLLHGNVIKATSVVFLLTGQL